MPLSPREIVQLRQIVSIAQKLLAKSAPSKGRKSKSIASAAKSAKSSARISRRTGKELIAFRKMIRAERKRGTPVAEIARKHGVTPNYIYQMK
jgi:hypothetical protein